MRRAQRGIGVAITEAKDEGNLSRANVVRKGQGRYDGTHGRQRTAPEVHMVGSRVRIKFGF